MVGSSVALFVATEMDLSAVVNVLLSSPSSAAPLVLPSLTIVMCSLLGATASDAGRSLMELLLQARLVRPSAKAIRDGKVLLPLKSELKSFTIFTAVVLVYLYWFVL